MTPKSIGSVLKYYRKLRNLSVNDVSLYLSENNSSASPKTIYGWENDHTEPNLHTLVLLCHLYEIDDISSAFGFTSADSGLNINPTEFELELIRRYREYPSLQPAINKLLDLPWLTNKEVFCYTTKVFSGKVWLLAWKKQKMTIF